MTQWRNEQRLAESLNSYAKVILSLKSRGINPNKRYKVLDGISCWNKGTEKGEITTLSYWGV